MSDFYTGLQATASRLLVQFGKPMTLRINTGSVYDPVAQTNAPTYTDYPVSGLVLNYAGRTSEAGTYVQTDDKKLLLSVAAAPEPSIGAQVVDGADVYTVQAIKSLSPAGINLLFELQGRK
jgi:hypothetical protein